MSQFIFNDGRIKSRIIRKSEDWYVVEWKYANDFDENGNPQITGRLTEEEKESKNIWFPWMAGTSEWLGLSDQDKAWAK